MTHIPASAGRSAVQPAKTTPKPPQRDTTRLRASPRCGARTRRGDACRAPAVGGKARCRMHGGARGSGGQPGNRNAWRHGLYDREAKAENRRHQGRLRSARALLHQLEAEARGRPLAGPPGGSGYGGGPALGGGAGAAPAEILGCMGSFANFAAPDTLPENFAQPPALPTAAGRSTRGAQPPHASLAPKGLCPARAGPLFCRPQGVS